MPRSTPRPTPRGTARLTSELSYSSYTEQFVGPGDGFGQFDGIELEMIWINGGSFNMGSPPGEKGRMDNEGPQHRVELDGYWLGKFEVTQSQWSTVMGTSPSLLKSNSRLPVVNVTWEEARQFCEKLSFETGYKYSLPSEAQWEYACRARSEGPYSTGRSISAQEANFNGDFTYGGSRKGVNRKKTIEVGSFQPNEFGFHDMHGNVWEWCSDWYDENYYERGPRNNPGGPSSGYRRVLRGGSWREIPSYLRSSDRRGITPVHRDNGIGFRVARNPD